MKSNIDDRISEGDIELNEPHFDEEATILAARPVVPLDEVKAEKRSRGGLALVVAIAGGLIIGLLAATLIFRQLGSNEAPTTASSDSPATRVAEPPTDQLLTADGGVTSIGETVTSNEEEKAAATDEGDRERKVEAKPGRVQDPAPQVEPRPRIIVREPPPADDEEPAEVQRSRRVERQEERRERRRAIREARRQQRGQDDNDDLTRIREIFEGSPRP